MEKISVLVSKLIEDFNTTSPYEICEQMGILIMHYDLPDKVKGFYIKYNGVYVIILHEELEHDEELVVLSHELGHIILHGDTNIMRIAFYTELCTSRYEKEADLFAAELLLRNYGFSSKDYEGFSVEEISCMTHIPKSLIELKFADAGIFGGLWA